jgi:hypothetical protein
MRSIKIIFVLAFISFASINSNAQAPGYLGKRLIVNYDLYTFPAIFNPNNRGNDGVTSLNFRNEISLDYVIGLHQSIGLSFHTTKTKFDLDRTFNYETDKSGSTIDINYKGCVGNISAYAFGLHTHLYFDQYIAPLGTYFKPEILYIRLKPSYDTNVAYEKMVDHVGQKLTNYPNLDNQGLYSTIAIGATIGTHYIFYDRLVVNVGFQFGWAFGGKKMNELMGADNITNKSLNESNYIPVSAKSRLMSQYFINVNAGVGFLIF